MTKRVLSLTGGAIPVFVWRLPTEVATYKQPRMQASQWVHVIRAFGQKGIKAAEIDDSKIIPWLEARGNEQVTREEIVEYVSYSLPSIKEARLSEGDVSYRQYSWARKNTENYNESLFYFPTVVEDFTDRIADLDEEISALNFDFERLGNDPDLVFRLDSKREDLLGRQKAATRTGYSIDRGTHFSATLTDLCPDARADFAHMRWSIFNFDGVKTLFVHEFQSDWAQKGRSEADLIQRREMFAALNLHRPSMGESEVPLIDHILPTADEVKTKAAEDLYVKYVGPLPGAPEWKGSYKKAPLVTETEYWTAFLLRRAMTLAVENGCHELTWINGSSMANGGQFGSPGLDEFYMKIVPSIAKKLAKPFKSELFLKDFKLNSHQQMQVEKKLATMPVTDEMREKFSQRVAVYSRARIYEAATFDPVRAAKLQHALQIKSNKMFGEDEAMRVSIVKDIMDACENQKPAGALIGRIAEVAFSAKDPVSVLNHEAFHFAHRYHFTSKDRELISAHFQPGSPLLVRTVRLLLSQDEMAAAQQAINNPEEAAAHAFSLWKKGLMPISKVEKVASNEAMGPITKVLNTLFPKANDYVESICKWIRGSSISPTDFVAKIVRAYGSTPVMTEQEKPAQPMHGASDQEEDNFLSPLQFS